MFLQPFVLWGLLLAALPVLIHLLNRMRYRTQPWAAMRLLTAATRRSVSQARLRQFLVLLFRVLAVVALVFVLSRPLAGGWLGWMLRGAPDVVLILLDRSASMEIRAAPGAPSRRELALQRLLKAGRALEGHSRFVLVDSATPAPQELGGLGALTDLSLTAATDTAADLPAMVQTGVAWLLENRAGVAEIWIASDLQRSNWRPDDPSWRTVLAQLAALPQSVRVRLLALTQTAEANAAVALVDVSRHTRGPESELHMVFDLFHPGRESGTLPLTLTLDGRATQVDVPVNGPSTRWRHRVPLGTQTNAGWGSVQLASDANSRDNIAFFAYGPTTPLYTLVVAQDPASGRVLRVAAAVAGGRTPTETVVLAPTAFTASVLAPCALLVWQAALPDGPTAEAIRAFVSAGGVALLLPPGQSDAGRFEGTGWGVVDAAEPNLAFRVARWEKTHGPLAKTAEGFSLPVGDLELFRRQRITGQRFTLAVFADGEAFLARQTLGRGEVYFLAGLPRDDWSTLAEGSVLVPMLQRLLQAGARRLHPVAAVACGELGAADRARPWQRVDSERPAHPQWEAGVYRSGERWLAVNRPAVEDEPEIIEPAGARSVFAGVPFQLWQERGGDGAALQREIWRLFLLAMLGFLLVEALLILPERAGAVTPTFQRVPREPAPVEAAP